MAIHATLQARLIANGINAGMPGWLIVDAANMADPVPGSALPIGDTAVAGLTKLMHAFYNYGRAHFTWAQNATNAAVAPGMLTGAAHACACATFNANLKWLAETVCAIPGIATPSPSRVGQFLTVPGGVCIDNGWKGNVRTSTQGFDKFKCFKFASHYWLGLGGQQFDVCFDKVFVGDVAWTALDPADAGALRDAGVPPNQLYKLAKPLPSADYLIMIAMLGPNNWPSWQLTSRADLKKMRR